MLKVQTSNVIKFRYTNQRGIESSRHVFVTGLYYGSTEYYPEEQWLMEGFDLDRSVIRLYAMKTMSHIEKSKVDF